MPATLTMHGKLFELRCDFVDKETCKLIPGYKWNATRRCWTYPATCSAAREIRFYFPSVQADGDARGIIEDCLNVTRQIEVMKDAGFENAQPLVEYPISKPMFKHQILGANIGSLLPFSAVLCEVGVGKTVIGIANMGRRYLDGEISRAVIVTPRSVTQVWPREFAKFADFPHDVRVLRGTGTQKKKQLTATQWDADSLCVAVVNYESAWRIVDELLAWGPQYLGCDEAHRCKSPSAAQSKGMHKLGAHCQFVQIFTGTLVSNHPLDVFSQCKIGDPSIFGNYFGSFRNHYAIMGGFEGRQVVAYRNLPDLERKLHAVSFRCTKAEVLDLPEVTDVTYTCELEPAARRVYRDLAKTKVSELSADRFVTTDNVLTKTLRLQQISGGFVTDDDGATRPVSTAKLELLADLLTDLFESGEKVIIFARFVAELDAIQLLLTNRGIDHVAIRGGVSDAKRIDAVDRFQDDPKCMALVGQIKAASEGLTLTASATSIFYSWDYSLIPYTQAKGRNHRPGQERPVTYIHLVCEDTMDVGSLQALQRKQNVADAIVDGLWRDLIEGRPIVTLDSFNDENADRASTRFHYPNLRI